MLRLKCAEDEANKNEVEITEMDLARITTESIKWALTSQMSASHK